MAYKKRCRENYKMLGTGAGSFKKDDDLIGRSVEMHNSETVKLAGDGAKIKGSIEGFDGGEVVIIVESEDVPFKNAGTTAIAVGSSIVGATRAIESGGTAQRGYVKAFSAGAADTEANIKIAINAAIKARGTVIDGGAAHAADQDVPADVKVSLSYG